ncbi:xanthine dehydrogenase accessory protein XdhC [Neptunicoccus cionae]|uniref:Xanthine dehydrogenase accessory protein XdhC n=1 Tax=Neptunicoccus cionae TaxID=2035344 RepID=A0A916VSL5_9RHOB|nr:xanthine dehydrogenase accessory protein XdhC [Amylibacter cionae]GGA27224.1 xanthine dehydrogenase accessory protein XdhC [Amylibacter cionae]
MSLAIFLSDPFETIRICLTRVRGSSPRGEGTEMFVTGAGLYGTIGGGQLEYMAIDAARALLKQGGNHRQLDIPLGPEIGQCCGGRVEISLQRMSNYARDQALLQAQAERSAYPHLYIFGAGHVGRALAAFAEALPLRTILIDSRKDELMQCNALVELRESALPEAEIDAAPAGSAFVVLTHDHALDFLLTAQALQRDDAAYVGMIGSATKRAKFKRFAAESYEDLQTGGLTCPIGAMGSADKRPAVIAACVAAEVITALTGSPAGVRVEKKVLIAEY